MAGPSLNRAAAGRRSDSAAGDAEERDDLGLVGLGVGDVGALAAAEPAGRFVHADEDAGVLFAVGVLDPDLVALLEARVGIHFGFGFFGDARLV
jgi:hypothetical protein